MRFTKMHGAGNDYVYVNCFEEPMPADPADLARRVSDRHFGIGGDGMILICPSQVADARMRMFNLDGSESEMCGNGVRCVAKYVYDHGICRNTTLRIETGNGVLSFELEVAGDKVRRVRVNMGEPILKPRTGSPLRYPAHPRSTRSPICRRLGNIPIIRPASWINDCGWDELFTCVSMGNPHLIMYCGQVSAVPLELIGPYFEKLPIFPRRINVHFVEKKSNGEVVMRTWERGSGITLACGTGACSVCVAGVLTGRTDRKILAHLPGGDLELEWNDRDNHVYMTGEAVEVFDGEWLW